MKHQRRRSFVAAAIVLTVGALSSCATLKVNPIPEPPPTAKLRVYVEAFTLGPIGRSWQIPHEQYAKNQIIRTGKFLEKKGIYEVVKEGNVRAAIGEQALNYDSMKDDDWAQARRIGKALHADYVLVIARNKSNVGTGEWVLIFTTELVSIETGKIFKSHYSVNNVIASDLEFQLKLIRETYRDMFAQAKHDMLAVAARKGRVYVPPAMTQEAPLISRTVEPSVPAKPAIPTTAVPKETVSPIVALEEAPAAKKEEPPVVAKAVAPPANLPGTGLYEEPKKASGAKKLVVYDLESNDQYRTVALILADALREEVFKLKQFVLVNREDLQKVLEEMALQQTGLIDEKLAVRTGKGLAANQVVTGRLGLLGNTFVMQAKRVDVETFSTLGIASMKYTEGQEEAALNRLPDFARSLVGLQ
jgi:hypothetical protein